jgi:hypothetical protein
MDFPTAGELSSSPLATLYVGNSGTVRYQNTKPAKISVPVL